jgi:probable rRNA maturation factor
MNVVIANRQRTRKINARLLKEIVEALLSDLEMEQAELGVTLVAAREMALLNESFLRHDGPTDVITFDYVEPRREKTRNGTRRRNLHGELFICTDVSLKQSREFKTTWQSEVVRYLVHGVLHLLGHDDHVGAARRRMKREENRLVLRLGRKFSLAKISRP